MRLFATLLLCLLTCTVKAGTYAEYKGDVYHQETHVKDFTVRGILNYRIIRFRYSYVSSR